MIHRKAGLLLVIFFIVAHTGCAMSQETPDEIKAKQYNIIIPPMKFVSPDDEKMWEGDINGRKVMLFRKKQDSGISDVIVSFQDELPKYFKRIEYLDKGADGVLDVVRMRVYEKTRGWREVGITKDNKYGLKYADGKYKGLLEEIKRRETQE